MVCLQFNFTQTLFFGSTNHWSLIIQDFLVQRTENSYPQMPHHHLAQPDPLMIGSHTETASNLKLWTCFSEKLKCLNKGSTALWKFGPLWFFNQWTANPQAGHIKTTRTFRRPLMLLHLVKWPGTVLLSCTTVHILRVQCQDGWTKSTKYGLDALVKWSTWFYPTPISKTYSTWHYIGSIHLRGSASSAIYFQETGHGDRQYIFTLLYS